MRGWLLGLALLAGCADSKPEPLKSLAPKPLPALGSTVSPKLDAGEDREAAYRVQPSEVFGEKLPKEALRWPLEGSAQAVPAGLDEDSEVLLVPSGDVYLAQAAGLLAQLDDAGATVFLAHPQGEVAYPLVLRDEAAFQAWLDEPKPGKVRIIQRADGFELQTNVGKLPGSDPNGPTVPLRGGQQDLALLRRGLGKLKERFTTSADLCFVPSFGTELTKVASAMSSAYREMGEPFFDEVCLVYPRPAVRDH